MFFLTILFSDKSPEQWPRPLIAEGFFGVLVTGLLAARDCYGTWKIS